MDQPTLIALVDRLRGLRREQSTIEFKSNWDKPEDVGQYISALANSAALEGHERAWMIWGVDNANHTVKGTTFDPISVNGEGNQPLIMWLIQKITPRPDFEFHKVEHPDGRIVVLEIHAPRTAPLAFSGERYIRIDSHKTRLSQHPDKEFRLWAMLGQKDDWSGEIVANATLEDLDPEALDTARLRFEDYLLKTERDAQRHEKLRTQIHSWDILTLLNKAHLTKQGRITRSALLLLGKDESSHLLAPYQPKLTWALRDENNVTRDSLHFGPPWLLSTEKLAACVHNIMLEHMPDGSLFPTAIRRYDSWVMREALHNCIAHQDYGLKGKINVIEHPDRLVFSNLGQFLPPSVEWMLEHQSPPEHYRNQWLIDGMIRLRMIDQAGSGIRRMFETQRDRFFPLPDYLLDRTQEGLPRVEVTVGGNVLDVNYTRLLMQRSDLSLKQVLLLDKVQKKRPISADEVKALRADKLIEGRAPNFFVSAKVAGWVGNKASYIHNRGQDNDYYQKLVIDYIKQYGQATRQEIDSLLLPKLPDVLNTTQKAHRVRNLIQAMRRDGLIHPEGPRARTVWRLGPP